MDQKEDTKAKHSERYQPWSTLGCLLPGVCADWNKMDPHMQCSPKPFNMFKLTKEHLGTDCPVSAAEFSNPEVDEIDVRVVATFLIQFS